MTQKTRRKSCSAPFKGLAARTIRTIAGMSDKNDAFRRELASP